MLTKRQRECLAFIELYQAEHGGVSPSATDIADALGLASKSGVVRLLDGLEERGKIRRIKFRSRAIEILKPASPSRGELVEAATRLVDRDARYDGGRVSFEFESHGEALRAVRALRDAIATVEHQR